VRDDVVDQVRSGLRHAPGAARGAESPALAAEGQQLVGLADWLTQRWNCLMWISATDFNTARAVSLSPLGGFGGEAAQRFAHAHGITDEGMLDKLKRRTGYYTSMVPSVPTRYHRLMDGQTLRIGAHEWRCHAGYGHAPEHMSLHAPSLGVLISGDMVLPRISTNVMVVDIEPEGNPLPLYLDSIARMKALPADTLVLPSHGLPFKGLHIRVDQLLSHHDDRYAEVVQACTERACTAAEVLPVLFKRELDLHQTTFALGETIAHLHALWQRGVLARHIDDQGVIRFRRA